MKGVNRVVIVVKDIERAGKLFSELIGIQLDDYGVVEDMGVRAMVSWDGGIELVSPTRSDTDVARFLSEKGEGVYGVVFNVEDADKASDRARRLGVRVKGTIEMGEKEGFRKFKEILLDPQDTHNVFTLLGQIERR